MDPGGLTVASLRRSMARLASSALFWLLLAWLAVWVVRVLLSDDPAVDFHRAIWPAAQRLVDGQDVYVPGQYREFATGDSFVYPPAAAVAAAPLTLFPVLFADCVVTVVCAASAVGALWVLGVRDWRCYVATVVAGPIVLGIDTANLSLPLVMGLALAWLWREHAARVALLIGLGVALKIFVWPLIVWLLVTRRRTGVYAAAAAAAITAGACVIVGFDEVPRFFNELSGLQRIGATMAATPYTLFVRLGASPAVAHVVAYALGAATLAGVVMASRRDDGDRRAFTLAVVASLVLSPIVWEHYFALLVAPLALARPRFDRYWLVFALGFIWCPGPPLHPSALEVAVSLAALGTIAYGCLRPDSTQSKRGAARVTGALRAPRPAHTT